MEERDYCLAFSLVPGIGPKRFKSLLNVFDSAVKAWQGSLEDFKKAGIGEAVFRKFADFRNSFDFTKYLEELERNNIYYIASCESVYPENLKKIDEVPIVLFIKGDIKLIDWSKTIAVVGTRKMTRYGEEVTEKLVSELVSCGFVIVSGLALGVDGVSHKTAIENHGKTIAVLGCGADLCFPRENEMLYQKIVSSSGIIVSEYAPGTQPSKGTFPARNRIISGLSLGVLVTEAGEDSGSLITASNAVLQEKPVFAVPGPITSKQSQGTAKLLKNGAVFIQDVNDILNFFKIKRARGANFDMTNLGVEEQKIIKVLLEESLNIDELAKRTKISVIRLNTILISLELEGIVKDLGGGEFGVRE